MGWLWRFYLSWKIFILPVDILSELRISWYDQASCISLFVKSDTIFGLDWLVENMTILIDDIASVNHYCCGNICCWYRFRWQWQWQWQWQCKSHLPHYLHHPAFSWLWPSLPRDVSSIWFDGFGTKPVNWKGISIGDVSAFVGIICNWTSHPWLWSAERWEG